MSLIQKTRLFFHNYLLKKQVKPKEGSPKKLVSFTNAKMIGILFNATDLDDRNIVLKYASKLKAKGKKIKLLGFFDNSLKDSNFTFDHFNKNNLDWALRPIGKKVQYFMNQKFDILLTLNPSTDSHSEYISTLSNAGLRVGPYTSNLEAYDLMLDPKDPGNIQKFINQIEFLLEKTNTKHEAAAV